MYNIYKLNYGNFPVRFILKDGDIFVPKDDLITILHDCSPKGYGPFWEKVFNDGLSFLGDLSDTKSAVISENSVGLVIHFHLIGNLLHSISELYAEKNHEMREISFKVNTFLRWYCDVLPDVDKHFGRSVLEMIGSVKNRLDRINPPYIVDVYKADGVWIGECDELGLATEANTYEELTERVWEVVPDLYECNNLGSNPDNIRISFNQYQSFELREVL